MTIYTLLFFTSLSLILLAIIWIKQLGILRGLLAISSRTLWILPIIIALFPEEGYYEIPQSLKHQEIHQNPNKTSSKKDKKGVLRPLNS